VSSAPGPIGLWEDDLLPDAQPDGKIIAQADKSFLEFQAGVDPLRPRAEAARDLALQASGWRDLHSQDVNGLFARYAPYQTLPSRLALTGAVTVTAPDDILRAQTPPHPGELTITDPLYQTWVNVWNFFSQAETSLANWVNSWLGVIPAGQPAGKPENER
jgi:hypothetical protein